MTEALINEALKLARGEWQRHMIKSGYDRLRGEAAYYATRYRESLWALRERLKVAGFKVTIFQPNSFSFYLVIGDPWVSWIEMLQELRDQIITLRERIRKVAEKNPKLKKDLSRQRILLDLRNLQGSVRQAIWFIAGYYVDYLDDESKDYIDAAEKAFNSAKQSWQQFLDRTKAALGVALL